MASLLTAIRFYGLPGDLIYSYAAGGLTPKATYTSQAETGTNTNPVVLDTSGYADIWLGAGAYRIIQKNALGVTYPHGDTDNILDASGAILTNFADSASASNGDALIAIKRTTAGAVATNLHLWNERQVLNARSDFGATGDGTTDDTIALNAWLSACYSYAIAGYLPAGHYRTTGLTATMAGNRLTQSLRLFGDGKYASRITKLSGSTPTLLVTSNTPTTQAVEANLHIADMAINGLSKGSHGLALTGMAYFTLERVLTSAADAGFQLNSCLVGVFRDCAAFSNNNGFITRKSGSASECNSITFDNCIVNYNSSHAFDLGQGSGLHLVGCDIEANGTTADVTTGGIFVRNTVDDSAFGYALVTIQNCWIEGNKGWSINAESAPALTFNVEGTKIIAPESGRAMTVAGAKSVGLRNTLALGNTATVTVTCDKFTFENCQIDALTDNSNYPHYIGSSTSTADFVSGKKGSYTGTLTGCTTSPTGSITWIKQGNHVTLNFPAISGTSNTTASTITGMPVELRPTTDRVVTMWTTDNGTEKVSRCSVMTSGVITLGNGTSGTFTASGAKGVSVVTLSYEI